MEVFEIGKKSQFKKCLCHANLLSMQSLSKQDCGLFCTFNNSKNILLELVTEGVKSTADM